MEIRRLRRPDVALLAEAVKSIVEPGDDGDGPASIEHLETALAEANTYLFVCFVDGRPVGYLSAYRFPATDHDGFLVYLYDVTVHRDYRRRGIGAQLVDALKRECHADDVTEIWVGTSITNAAAQRTFESTGAKRVSDTYVEYIYDLGDDGV